MTSLAGVSSRISEFATYSSEVAEEHGTAIVLAIVAITSIGAVLGHLLSRREPAQHVDVERVEVLAGSTDSLALADPKPKGSGGQSRLRQRKRILPFQLRSVKGSFSDAVLKSARKSPELPEADSPAALKALEVANAAAAKCRAKNKKKADKLRTKKRTAPNRDDSLFEANSSSAASSPRPPRRIGLSVPFPRTGAEVVTLAELMPTLGQRTVPSAATLSVAEAAPKPGFGTPAVILPRSRAQRLRDSRHRTLGVLPANLPALPPAVAGSSDRGDSICSGKDATLNGFERPPSGQFGAIGSRSRPPGRRLGAFIPNPVSNAGGVWGPSGSDNDAGSERSSTELSGTEGESDGGAVREISTATVVVEDSDLW